MSTTLHPPISRSIQLAVVVVLLATLATAVLLATTAGSAPVPAPVAETQVQDSGGDTTGIAPTSTGCHPASARGHIEGLTAPTGRSDCSPEPSRVHRNFFE